MSDEGLFSVFDQEEPSAIVELPETYADPTGATEIG